MNEHETYMHRCIQLAKLGAGHVAPNPLVGAVLVHESRIIGEGFHQRYGKAHAEVNCIASVKEDDLKLVSSSTLYVSLEPCVHFGKTPPCTDLIIANKIAKVVVGCTDPYAEVKGKGIEKLKKAGIEVLDHVLLKECLELNKRFITFQLEHRPYVVLKWAQSRNGKMARTDRQRFAISNEFSRRLVHQWRSEEASILVGANTAFHDDPELSNRFWHGANPIRLVTDMELRLPSSLKLFNGEIPTTIFNSRKHSLEEIDFTSHQPLGKDGLAYYQVTTDVSLVQQIMHALYQLKIQSVLVEGGGRLLQSFIDENYWDEIRLITNKELNMDEGVVSPVFNGIKMNEQELFSDRIELFKPVP
jgi:diaminohydroxyphosphoribosylaminopyrimidine deaminase/5-amino-6-(5-phosphoribosylamino)uracil reductase